MLALRYLGSATRVTLQVGAAEITALAPSGTPLPEPGSSVGFDFDVADLHHMDEA